jgi:hypothetical protein
MARIPRDWDAKWTAKDRKVRPALYETKTTNQE